MAEQSFFSKYSKWLGGGLGFVLGGPIGALFGYAVGSLFENVQIKMYQGTPGSRPTGRSRTQRNDVDVSLLLLIAAVIRADDRISQHELNFVRQFFRQNFGNIHLEEKMALLHDLLRKDIQLRPVCAQIKMNTTHAVRLQLLHILFGVSKSDGEVHPKEVEVIHRISHYLGIGLKDFESIKAMFFVEPRSNYTILGIDPSASDSAVKKAYRKLVLKYHPDKVGHLGEKYKKTASAKFQKVQEAFDAIRLERGLK